MYLPLGWAQIDALREQVGPYSGCIVQCHLFEPQAKNEKYCSYKVVAGCEEIHG